MDNMEKRCIICNLPEGKYGVILNDTGVCNYCTYFERVKPLLLDYSGREQIFLDRIKKLKGKYKFDALVGLSGGKDSTYVVYQLVKKYKLKVLAVTLDNGFLTDFARESVKRTVKALGIDHIYYKPDWDVYRNFYRMSVKKMGSPCIACAMGGYFLSIKACYERKIPFFIHGRTPFQMYRNISPDSKDLFLLMIQANLKEHSFPTLAQVYQPVNEIVKQSVAAMADSLEDAKSVTEEFFIDSNKLAGDFAPEFLAYFLFEEYHEEKIKKLLEKELGWRRPRGDILLGHYDCALYNAATYMYTRLNDIDENEPDVAVMVRFGVMSKEKAKELIRRGQPSRMNLEKSLDTLCSLCGYSRADLEMNLAMLKKAGVTRFHTGF
jgi:hypothetical protein